MHIELPEALTGVKARIVVALGALFPDDPRAQGAGRLRLPRAAPGRRAASIPTRQRAVWPSTGNYCRGGVAISRILGCRGVAVLPAGMSQERFDWLGQWVTAPEDIVRTPGTESNVKEIYDTCAELARDPANEIVNQFSEFGNYLAHWRCTGPALEKIFLALRGHPRAARLAGFVSASGSAGTLAAGDYLKAQHGTKIAVVEAVECPTLLNNGYGEHNIQGIGDKHVPLIHNVMNTDLVIGISDQATDGLNAVFNTDVGPRLPRAPARPAAQTLARALGHFGLSSIANMLGAIKMAKHLRPRPRRRHRHRGHRRPRDVPQRARALPAAPPQPGRHDDELAAELVGRHLLGADTEHVLDATQRERERIFNLGYFTWVEQQGIALADFDRRKSQDFWHGPAGPGAAVGRDDHGLQSRQRHGWPPHDHAEQERRRMSKRPLVTPYQQLREETLARDRGLREKVMSLEEAAKLVSDGDHVALGGCHLSRTPHRHDLGADPRAQARTSPFPAPSPPPRATCCSPPASSKHVVTSWFSQGLIWGVSKVMRHYTENKLAVFEEWSHMSMGLRYRAGAMGIPFMPSRTMLGSDVGERLGDSLKTMTCPFTGEELALLPALNPDCGADPRAALRRVRQRPARRPAVHGSRHRHGRQAGHHDDRAHRLQRADPPHARPDAHPLLHGRGRGRGADGLRAARVLRRLRAVLLAPRRLRARHHQGPDQGRRKEYLERYYYEPKSWPDYLAKLGMDAVLDACRRGRSVHND